ncbi:MAG: type III polyketide synthase [Cyclobacteriaceae bacterium]|nr:type III polyketide synthase [Cyclobacteriaceae bacterium]
MSFITSIGTANPANKFSQAQLADFMIQAMQLNEQDTRKLKTIFRASGIETRYSVIDDYGKKDEFKFYSNGLNLEPLPTTKERLELFREKSLSLSLQAISDCLAKVSSNESKALTHLIVVSCTGLYAPGLDIDLVKSLNLSSNIQRLCINFMGCYAAFNAIKIANAYCESDPNAKVLVVCTELCSIHFQKECSDDNLLANALFADGSAALLIESSPRKGVNLKPVSFFCDLAPEGAQDMAWTVGDLGFEMRLSAYVPEVIKRGIASLTKKLLAQISNQLSDISYYAIHPGGKKILEVIEQELGLTKKDNQASYEILKKFGNMSSPTVLFVLNEISKNLNGVDSGKKILSFAFGPGLTLESLVLEIQNHS